jgi:hypothetical protein
LSKYEPLIRYLADHYPATVSLTFGDLDRIVGGLPPSARSSRNWWGNTVNPRHVQAAAWAAGGYRVESIALGLSVTFAPGRSSR